MDALKVAGATLSSSSKGKQKKKRAADDDDEGGLSVEDALGRLAPNKRARANDKQIGFVSAEMADVEGFEYFSFEELNGYIKKPDGTISLYAPEAFAPLRYPKQTGGFYSPWALLSVEERLRRIKASLARTDNVTTVARERLFQRNGFDPTTTKAWRDEETPLERSEIDEINEAFRRWRDLGISQTIRDIYDKYRDRFVATFNDGRWRRSQWKGQMWTPYSIRERLFEREPKARSAWRIGQLGAIGNKVVGQIIVHHRDDPTNTLVSDAKIKSVALLETTMEKLRKSNAD